MNDRRPRIYEVSGSRTANNKEARETLAFCSAIIATQARAAAALTERTWALRYHLLCSGLTEHDVLLTV
jgi:hypothetical protein